MKKWGLYEWSVISFFFIVPVVATVIEIESFYSNNSVAAIALKWLVFSGIGLRLGSAGIKQILQPDFTAKNIFDIKDEKAYVVVRELGIANTCFALIALLSLGFGSFRIPAAIAGGMYFGLAGLLHIFNSKNRKSEVFAMVTDFYIFMVLLILILLSML